MSTKQSSLDVPVRIELPCIRVSQPIGDFFIAAIKANDICEITFADVRRMSGDRDVDTYLGIQREVSPPRVKDLREFVNTVDACFPSSIILAVESRCAEYDEERSILILKSYEAPAGEDQTENVSRIEIAKVLDGQHRIEGLRGLAGGSSTFEVNISVFVEMDIESQAYLFSIVNLAQTKVSRSLAYDLFEYSKSRSPQKTCHNIAVVLDRTDTSPFYKKIKRLGVATKGRFNETLTQATFVEALMPYVSEKPVEDRDLFKRGKKPALVSADKLRKLVFRNMFLQEEEIQIADTLFNYFSAIKQRWPKAWDQGGAGLMLNKTNGFRAMMRLLRPIYLRLGNPGNVPTVSDFSALFSKSKLADDDFNIDNFVPGTSGETALYNRLMDEFNLRQAMKQLRM